MQYAEHLWQRCQKFLLNSFFVSVLHSSRRHLLPNGAALAPILCADQTVTALELHWLLSLMQIKCRFCVLMIYVSSTNIALLRIRNIVSNNPFSFALFCLIMLFHQLLPPNLFASLLSVIVSVSKFFQPFSWAFIFPFDVCSSHAITVLVIVLKATISLSSCLFAVNHSAQQH